MKHLPFSTLKQWASQLFEAKAYDKAHYQSFKKFFDQSVEQINSDLEVDILTQSQRAFDTEFPDDQSIGSFHENSVAETFELFLKSLNEGHTAAYAEAYAEEWYQSECPERASTAAYEKIGISSPTPNDPGYLDCYQACIHQGKSEKFARKCAENLFEYDYCFPYSFKKTEQRLRAYDQKIKEGRSEMYASEYEHKLDWWSPPFPEIYADCYEYQRSLGRDHDTSETIAMDYVDLYDLKPTPEEFDHGQGSNLNDWPLACAEANYRFNKEERRSKPDILDKFLNLSLSYPYEKNQSTLEHYDKIESLIRQVIAGDLNYQDIPVISSESEKSDSSDKNQNNSSVDDQKYRDWCADGDLDPADEENRDTYKEVCAETEGFWDNLDEDDAEGWADYMTKDFD